MTAFEKTGAAPAAVRDRLAAAHLYLCTDARESRGDFDAFVAACFAGGVDINVFAGNRATWQRWLRARTR